MIWVFCLFILRNIFDWTCYLFLMVVIVTHVADIIHHSEPVARAHINLMAITIILLWIRLMKCARPFSLVGKYMLLQNSTDQRPVAELLLSRPICPPFTNFTQKDYWISYQAPPNQIEDFKTFIAKFNI